MLFKFSLVLSLCAFCGAEDLPSFVKKCRYGDVECIVESANDIMINHHHEWDKMHIKYTEPWRYRDIISREEENRSFQAEFDLRDNIMYGLTGIRFNRAVGWEEDIKNSKFEIHGHNNLMNFTGKYQLDGRFLLIPVEGEGDFSIQLEDITIGVRVKGREVIKNGKKHLKIKKLKLLLVPSKFHVDITGLFGDNKQLAQSVLDIVHENWRAAWDEHAPAAFGFMEGMMKDMWQDFFDAFPYEDMFLHEK